MINSAFVKNLSATGELQHYMDVVMLNVTLHHILFFIFNQDQNEKKKFWQTCGKLDPNRGKSTGRAGLYQQFRQDIRTDKFHSHVGKGVGSTNDKSKSGRGGR